MRERERERQRGESKILTNHIYDIPRSCIKREREREIEIERGRVLHTSELRSQAK